MTAPTNSLQSIMERQLSGLILDLEGERVYIQRVARKNMCLGYLEAIRDAGEHEAIEHDYWLRKINAAFNRSEQVAG